MKPAKIMPFNQNTLSAKKQKQKKLKNVSRVVLAESSYSFKGQELTIAECIQFQEKMISYFMFKPQPALKWSELKHYSKEERKAMKPKVRIPSRNCLALGFNEVSRALEQKLATIVILSDGIKPNVLYKHICQHCTVHNIPLLRVRNFKKLSNMCFGFSSMMMAFKQVEKSEKVYEFYKSVQDFYKNEYSVPSTSNSNMEVRNPVESKIMVKQKPERSVLAEPAKNVYVYRLNASQRSFIPQPKMEPSKIFKANYIPFSGYVPVIASSSHTKLDNLIVRKITGNPNRKRKGNQQN